MGGSLKPLKIVKYTHKTIIFQSFTHGSSLKCYGKWVVQVHAFCFVFSPGNLLHFCHKVCKWPNVPNLRAPNILAANIKFQSSHYASPATDTNVYGEHVDGATFSRFYTRYQSTRPFTARHGTGAPIISVHKVPKHWEILSFWNHTSESHVSSSRKTTRDTDLRTRELFG